MNTQNLLHGMSSFFTLSDGVKIPDQDFLSRSGIKLFEPDLDPYLVVNVGWLDGLGKEHPLNLFSGIYIFSGNNFNPPTFF